MAEGGFDFPIAGGDGELVINQLKSRDFLTGVRGWVIRRDGSAEFLSVVIRGDLQSDNYVPGVSGWKLDRSGTAELLDVFIRGTLESANYDPGLAGWHLDESGAAEFAQVLINSFGLAGKVEIADGKIEVFNSLGELVIGIGVDAAAPFFGPYFAMYDTVSGDPRIRMNIPSPGSIPVLRVSDATDTGYVQLDPGTGFGAAVQIQPVDSGADFSPGLLQGAEAGIPGLPALEIYSPENSTHAGLIRSLIQLQGGYQFRQSSKINIVSDENEIAGPVRATRLRPESVFSGPDFTTNVTVNYSGVGLTGSVLELTLPSVLSGVLRVDLAARGANSLAGTPSYMSFEIRENDAAGTVLRAAQDVDLQHQDANGSRFGISNVITGLPYSASLNYFVRVMHKVGGGLGTWSDRRLIVTPQP